MRCNLLQLLGVTCSIGWIGKPLSSSILLYQSDLQFMCTQPWPSYHSFIVMNEIGQADTETRKFRLTKRQIISLRVELIWGIDDFTSRPNDGFSLDLQALQQKSRAVAASKQQKSATVKPSTATATASNTTYTAAASVPSKPHQSSTGVWAPPAVGNSMSYTVVQPTMTSGDEM